MALISADQEFAFYDENVVYQINSFGADFTVDGLIARFERGDIYRPEFQRSFVWNIAQASRFIESILLGLPIPSVFFYREEDSGKHLIVDGLQRLTSLHGFATGKFPSTDRKFCLRRVQPRFEGRTVRDLEASDQRRFFDAIIHAIIIQQLAPDDDRSSVFHIFERLNSNGTPLRAQEMRAAIYHGLFQELLGHLNGVSEWRQIFGVPHKRSKDQELILRFLALHFEGKDYRKPMAAFLNHFMFKNRNLSGDSEAIFDKAFVSTIRRVFEALGTAAFKPRKAFNVALFDSFMVGVAQNPKASPEIIRRAYSQLLEDKKFRYLTERATSDELSVLGRIDMAAQAIRAAA